MPYPPLAVNPVMPYIFIMARPLKLTETTQVRLIAGKLDEIDAILLPDERRGDLIRTAIDRELTRRKGE